MLYCTWPQVLRPLGHKGRSMAAYISKQLFTSLSDCANDWLCLRGHHPCSEQVPLSHAQPASGPSTQTDRSSNARRQGLWRHLKVFLGRHVSMCADVRMTASYIKPTKFICHISSQRRRSHVHQWP